MSALFGGIDPALLAQLTSRGYATWIDATKGGKGTTAQAACVVHAPASVLYEAATDFDNIHRYVSMSKSSKVKVLGDNRKQVTFRQRVGLPLLSVGLDLCYDFKLDPGKSVRCERYVSGAFDRSHYEMDFIPLDEHRTLYVLTLYANVASLGWLVRIFLSRIPELEVAIAASVPVIPMTALAAEAERRSGPSQKTPSLELVDAVNDGLLDDLLGTGILSVGRLDDQGQIEKVSTASRIDGCAPTDLWPLLADPAKRISLISVVDRGRILHKDAERLSVEYGYKLKLGILRKTYTIEARGPYVEPESFVAEAAYTDGSPAVYSHHVRPTDAGSILCHSYYTDLKKDWLSTKFLSSHPEFERLIACYAPFILVRALRDHLAR